MGCCFCHSASSVVENPDVTSRTLVEKVVVLRGTRTGSTERGLAYIKNDYLNYEPPCGLCLCCTLCRNRHRLTKISRVEYIEDEMLLYRKDKGINLSPGLRVTVPKNDTTLLIATPEAETFTSELKSACGLVE